MNEFVLVMMMVGWIQGKQVWRTMMQVEEDCVSARGLAEPW